MQYTFTEHPMITDNARFKHLSNIAIVPDNDPEHASRLNQFKDQMFQGVGIATQSNRGSGWEHYLTSPTFERVDPVTGDVLTWVRMDYKKP